jgi:hypothetical protein
VDFGDDSSADQSFDRSTCSSIEVFLRSGNGRFRVDQIHGAFADEALTVHGAGGHDTLDGGDGAELFDGGGGRDAADGNRGNDTGVLGSGWNSLRWDPGDGSDVILRDGKVAASGEGTSPTTTQWSRRNSVRRALDRLAHRIRHAAGELGPDAVPADGDHFAVGDRLIARAPDRNLHPPGQRHAYVRNERDRRGR